ncbi:MAG: hypothetical protein ACLFSW_06850 [Halobacteriales archaeon]
MVNKSTLVVSTIGVGLMVAGVALGSGTQASMIAFVAGFVLTVGGLALGVKDATGSESKNDGTTDRPALIRAVGVGVGLASLVTPYFRSPVTPGAAETAESVVDVLATAAAGVEAHISFVVLILVVVVLAGSFLAVFHHAGGYVMLLGGMTTVFILMERAGSFDAVTQEVGYGIYLMLFAAFIIISSSLSDTTDVFDSDTDWGSKLLVLK